MVRRTVSLWGTAVAACLIGTAASAAESTSAAEATAQNWSSLSVLVLATFVGLGVIGRVSR